MRFVESKPRGFVLKAGHGKSDYVNLSKPHGGRWGNALETAQIYPDITSLLRSVADAGAEGTDDRMHIERVFQMDSLQTAGL